MADLQLYRQHTLYLMKRIYMTCVPKNKETHMLHLVTFLHCKILFLSFFRSDGDV